MTSKEHGLGVSVRTKVLAAILLAVLPLVLAIAAFTVYATQDERAIRHMLALGAERYLSERVEIAEPDEVLDADAARVEEAAGSDG